MRPNDYELLVENGLVIPEPKNMIVVVNGNELVPVVRCRDCKHWNPNGIGICKLHDIRPTPLMMDDFFCADGERSGNE